MRSTLFIAAALVAVLPLATRAAGPATLRVRPAALPVAGTIVPGRGGEDPRAIIVQGGISPEPACDGGRPVDGDGAVAIGPKQDDPAPAPSNPSAAARRLATDQGALAIGPKQDDPAPAPANPHDAVSAMASGRGAVAIGPKQDDPATPPPRSGTLAMAGRQGPVALGPKQDDPIPPAPDPGMRCKRASH